jgi:hypothetical protein
MISRLRVWSIITYKPRKVLFPNNNGGGKHRALLSLDVSKTKKIGNDDAGRCNAGTRRSHPS